MQDGIKIAIDPIADNLADDESKKVLDGWFDPIHPVSIRSRGKQFCPEEESWGSEAAGYLFAVPPADIVSRLPFARQNLAQLSRRWKIQLIRSG